MYNSHNRQKKDSVKNYFPSPEDSELASLPAHERREILQQIFKQTPALDHQGVAITMPSDEAGWDDLARRVTESVPGSISKWARAYRPDQTARLIDRYWGAVGLPDPTENLSIFLAAARERDDNMLGPLHLAARDIIQHTPTKTVTGLQPHDAKAFLLALPGEYQKRILKIAKDRLFQAKSLERTAADTYARKVADVMAGFEPHIADDGWHDDYKKFMATSDDKKRIVRAMIKFLDEVTPKTADDIRHPMGRGVRMMVADEDEIREVADELADMMVAAKKNMSHGRSCHLTPDNLRSMDPTWWRRRLRKEARLTRQYWQAALGAASKGRAEYCSDYTLNAFLDCQRKGLSFATAQVIYRDEVEVSLAKVKDSKLKARGSRIYAQCKAFEQIADRYNADLADDSPDRLIPVFLSPTLPGEWHPHPTEKAGGFRGRSWTPDYTPNMACSHLQILWERLRARLGKIDVQTLGLSVKECHADGCIHQHALLWVPANKILPMWRELRKTYPGLHQIKVKIIKPRKNGLASASPSTYLLKYLTKTLPMSGEQILSFNDMSQDDQKMVRVRAQMSEMNVRRSALLGVHGMQMIWQCIRAATAETLKGMPERARHARDLMNTHRYAEALEIMGGWQPHGDDGDGRLVSYYEETIGRYGDAGKRWAGFMDDMTGEVWTAARWGIKKVESPLICAVTTLGDIYPRRGASPPLRDDGEADLPLPMAA